MNSPKESPNGPVPLSDSRSVVLRSIILAPYLIANVIAAILWFWMLDPLLGFINALLQSIGVARIPFFSDQQLALPTIAAVNIWRHMGFVALLFYTGSRSSITNQWWKRLESTPCRFRIFAF